jgi:hypothetical protein
MAEWDDPAKLTLFRLEDRNRAASAIIDRYVNAHGVMDVGVGLIGLLPGAAIPALVTAIGLQAPVIYQPLARKLARIYLAPPEDLEDVQSDIVLPSALVYTAGLDIAADFGVEFIANIAGELVIELGFGSLATFIPVVGAFVGATLDYVIATKMTRRVGKMVSIYFQNGAHWVCDKRKTYEVSKTAPDDLNAIRTDIRTVRESQLRNVKSYVDVMKPAVTNDQIRQALRAKGIPDDLISDAL